MNPLSDLVADWPAIDALLDEALDLPAAERPVWLEALVGRAGLAPPIIDAVRRLLSAPGRAETASFLQELPCIAPPADGAPVPGLVVGPWRLLREIGRGGMGQVFLAERADGSLRRQVALKLPRLTWAQDLAQRMARERDILATLEHPHIARLYDAGVDGVGRPWLAMEYVQGRAIDRYAGEQGLDVPARLALLLQVCEAVAHAHRHLVIHRDLKPDNMLVTDDGQVRLLDFGIARLLIDASPADGEPWPAETARMLTPEYASPEQLRGEPLSTASDVYSLGVVAYELLSGARPFGGTCGDRVALAQSLLEQPVAPASRVADDPARARALRGDLDAVLLQALRKSPAERYASVDALAADLSRHLAGQPVSARAEGTAYRLRKWVGRHRLPVALATGAVLSLLLGTAGALWQRAEALQQAQRAADEAARARQAAERAEAELDAQWAVRDMYIESFMALVSKARTDVTVFAKPQAVSGVVEPALRDAIRRRADLPHPRLALLDAAATLLNYTNDLTNSVAISREYIAALKAQAASAERVILAHAVLGSSLNALGRFDEAEQARRDAIAWAPQEQDRRTERARIHQVNALAGMLVRQGRRDEARPLIDRADAVTARDFADSNVRQGVLRTLADFHAGFDPQAALRAAQAQHDHPAVQATNAAEERASAQTALANALGELGRWPEAEGLLRQALQATERAYGASSRQGLRVAGALVAALGRQQKFDQAQALLDAQARQAEGAPAEVAEALRLAVGQRRLELAWLQGDRAAIVRHRSAQPARLLAITLIEQGPTMLLLEARALAALGRHDEAQQRLDLVRARLGDPQRPSLLSLRWHQARVEVLLDAGRFDDAQPAAEALLALITRAQGPASKPLWAQAVAFDTLAQVHARRGDPDVARRWLQARTELVTVPSDTLEETLSARRSACTQALLGDRSAAAPNDCHRR